MFNILGGLDSLQVSSPTEATSVIDGQREINFITGSIAAGKGATASGGDDLINKVIALSGVLLLVIIGMRFFK